MPSPSSTPAPFRLRLLLLPLALCAVGSALPAAETAAAATTAQPVLPSTCTTVGPLGTPTGPACYTYTSATVGRASLLFSACLPSFFPLC